MKIDFLPLQKKLMATIKPFKGYRPKPEFATQVASRPYDVLSSEEAKEEAKGNDKTFLHVCKPEIDLDSSIDHYDDKVYAKAVENWNRLKSDGTFLQDKNPCMYAYRQIMNGHAQIGLVANSSIEDYFNDVIKKHEYTRPEKENDRIRHMYELQCHPEPVFLTYPDIAELDEIMTDKLSSLIEKIYENYELNGLLKLLDRFVYITGVSKSIKIMEEFINESSED